MVASRLTLLVTCCMLASGCVGSWEPNLRCQDPQESSGALPSQLVWGDGGFGVAVARDGNVTVAAEWQNELFVKGAGAETPVRAWVFNSTWLTSNDTHELKLRHGGTMQSASSVAVAIADGFVAVGLDAGKVNSGAHGEGLVHIFSKLEDGTWGHLRDLRPSRHQGSEAFGAAVQFHGGYLLVGAPYEDGHADRGLLGRGAVYVFDSKNHWQEVTILKGPEQRWPDYVRFDQFGSAVASHGSRIAVADPTAFPDPVIAILNLSDGQWQPKDLVRPPGEYGMWAMALHDETMLVGSPRDRAVWVYQFEGEGWNLTQTLRPPGWQRHGQRMDNFGAAVALGEQNAFVLAPTAKAGCTAGLVFVFEKSSAGWTLRDALRPAGGMVDEQLVEADHATAVSGYLRQSLVSDENTLVWGRPVVRLNGTLTGAVASYDLARV